jgi:pimeloyl-ACP methyl ester carboxylesterase
MVLLHGLASNARIWDLVAPRLGQGRPVYALDQRGHGLSDKPDDGYDFPTVAGDLRAFVEALQLERPVIVGHSWGASVALVYAAAQPAGPWAPSAIALVDGGTALLRSLPGMTWEEAEARLRPPSLAGMPREKFIERMAKFMPDPALLTPQVIEIVLGNFEVLDDDTIRPRLTLARHMAIARALYDLEVEEVLPRVRCPILLAPAAPPEPLDENASQFLALKRRGVARAEKLQPDARTHWFENTVHDVPLHRPEALADVIEDFLKTSV